MNGTELASKSPPECLPGDADCDGDVTLSDAILMLQVLCKAEPPPAVHLEADANGDGWLGSGDVAFVLQSVGGLR